MNISEPKSVTVPELALIAATRGAIGFGAGLLLADKFKDTHATCRKGTHSQLFMTRDTEFSDQKNIQRRAQRFRYYIGHYNPQGNVFCAFAMRNKLVSMLDPKPAAYAGPYQSATSP